MTESGNALRRTYFVSCRGRLEEDILCVLQGTPWDRLVLCLTRDAWRRTYSVSCRGCLETDLCCAGDALRQTCSVSYKGSLKTVFFWVLQGTPWDRLVLCRGRLETDLCCAGNALRQTCVVQGTPWDRIVLCRGRLETNFFCVLQWTPWDGLILCLAGDALRQPSSVLEGICQLPAKANSAELITALRRRLGEWKYVPTY